MFNTCNHGYAHDFNGQNRCKNCGIPICQTSLNRHHLSRDTNACIFCGKPWCELGNRHAYGDHDRCIYCHRSRCEITERGHDFNGKNICKNCGIPICQTSLNRHHLSRDTNACIFCGKPWCELGNRHAYGNNNCCIYCHKSREETNENVFYIQRPCFIFNPGPAIIKLNF